MTTGLVQERPIKIMNPPKNSSSNYGNNSHNNSNKIVPKYQNAKTKIPDSVIDSALLAALRDPRERLGLLKLEQVMLDFMQRQPQDPCLDVGGPYNSVVQSPSQGMLSQASMQNAHKTQTTFQRCILHRLADRFHIARDNNTDGTIRLLKSAESKVPDRLLLNVHPSEYSLEEPEQPSITLGTTNSATATNSSTAPSTSTSATANVTTTNNNPKKNRKMKIMKRSNSSPATAPGNRTKDAAKKRTSWTEKEKAYAEARARIMGTTESDQAQEMAPTTTTTTTTAKTVKTPLHNSASDPSFYMATTSTTESSSISSIKAIPQVVEEAAARRSSSTTNTNTKAKATFRDRRQEENDPDFQRGGLMPMPHHHPYATTAATAATTTTTTHDYYNNPTNDYYGYSNPPPTQQSQGMMHNGGGGGGPSYGPGYPPAFSPPVAAQYGYNAAEWAPSSVPPSQGQPSSRAPANLHSLEEFPSLSLR
jgi:hypothetical protein